MNLDEASPRILHCATCRRTAEYGDGAVNCIHVEEAIHEARVGRSLPEGPHLVLLHVRPLQVEVTP